MDTQDTNYEVTRQKILARLLVPNSFSKSE